MKMPERYNKLRMRAFELNTSLPWLYSDYWLDLTLAEIDDAFSNEDLEHIKDLENELL